MIKVSEIKRNRYLNDEYAHVADINGSISENERDLVVKGFIKDITLLHDYSLEKLIENNTELKIEHYSDGVLKDSLPYFGLTDLKIDLSGNFTMVFTPYYSIPRFGGSGRSKLTDLLYNLQNVKPSEQMITLKNN
jgi:hypothetical protein